MESAKSCCVEVSGWDRTENFFAEKTVLDWTEREKTEISLRSALREGSVVFVRLVEPPEESVNCPVAYQVAKVARTDAAGRSMVELVRLHPRTPYMEAVRLAEGSEIKWVLSNAQR